MNSCLEYGTAVPCGSSTAVLEFWHDAFASYAQTMGKKQQTDENRIFGFGARLKAARIKAEITQAELGKGAGEFGKDANKQSISDWEAERYYPKVDQLRVMCLRLNASADELVFGDVRQAAVMAQAESVVRQLTQAQRDELLKKMQGPAVSDEHVEEKMPITKKPAKERK